MTMRMIGKTQKCLYAFLGLYSSRFSLPMIFSPNYVIYSKWIKDLNEKDDDMDIEKDVKKLAKGFESCAKILTAIGDETRQHLILEMMQIECCTGARVGEITEKTNLSRPAVSHHLQILKDAGIVKVRKEGTKNYYYFDPEMKMLEQLIDTLQLARDITIQLPDRSGDKE